MRPAALRFSTTFHGGLLASVFFIILTVTGVLLMYEYVPTPEGAWESIRWLEQGRRSGSMIRTAHNLAAQAMLLAVALHLASLMVRRAHERRKWANWLVGVALFLLTVALSYTGYLLPWDQLAYWAITVGGNMAASAPGFGPQARGLLLGGEDIGGVTLLRFYVHHCITLPIAFVGLMALHLYRIRRDQGLSLPRPEPNEQPPLRDRASILRWELEIMLLVTGALGVISFLVAMPLGPKADPSVTPNPMKAPWYLVGLQELLHFHDAAVVTWVVPVVFFLLLAAIPLLPERLRTRTLGELSRVQRAALHTLLAALVFLSLLPAYHPNLTVVSGCALFSWLLHRSRRGDWLGRRLAAMAWVSFLLLFSAVTYLGLVAVALWLRGPDWTLVW